ncbi:hypothetical protein OOK31_25480 [Streptomyces sp. NBC_00249]|uniref:hypothetical protein n=1 Tax=Streptomyces sp. NBC_00249 TaxID=2975690 RepID=UPI00225BD258|nr:hypothetical protein [Streptomyces sp. NBC_00249]MCX5197209.1 hypothetical protein [Streptomyces sp. NBC_00249]
MTETPISPTRVILPSPANPPRPPAPPAWWMVPAAPAPSAPLDVRVTVDLVIPGPPPEPEVRWWHRIRWGYNATCALCAMPLAGLWAPVLEAVRDDAGLAAAWTIAAAPLTVLGVLDNTRRVQARYAHEDLWAPRIRAAIARTLLLAASGATAMALPVTTVVYLVTGVRT